MRKFRITDKSGRTVGSVTEQPSALDGLLGIVILVAISPVLLVVIGLFVGISTVWGWATSFQITPFPNINGLLVIVSLSVVTAAVSRVMIGILKRGHVEQGFGATFAELSLNGKLYRLIMLSATCAVFSVLLIGLIGLTVLPLVMWIVQNLLHWLFSTNDSYWSSGDTAALPAPAIVVIGVFWAMIAVAYGIYLDRHIEKESKPLIRSWFFYLVLFFMLSPLVGIGLMMVTNTASWSDFEYPISRYGGDRYVFSFSSYVACFLGGAVIGFLLAPFIRDH